MRMLTRPELHVILTLNWLDIVENLRQDLAAERALRMAAEAKVFALEEGIEGALVILRTPPQTCVSAVTERRLAELFPVTHEAQRVLAAQRAREKEEAEDD